MMPLCAAAIARSWDARGPTDTKVETRQYGGRGTRSSVLEQNTRGLTRAQAGVGYRFKNSVEIDGTFDLATAADDALGAFNRNHGPGRQYARAVAARRDARYSSRAGGIVASILVASVRTSRRRLVSSSGSRSRRVCR